MKRKRLAVEKVCTSVQTLPQKQNVKAQVQVAIDIYITQHCDNCAYAYEVAAGIRCQFPSVQVRIVDIATTSEVIPEVIFATPTYLLNGRVWSLGNPAPTKVREISALVNGA